MQYPAIDMYTTVDTSKVRGFVLSNKSRLYSHQLIA